MGDHPDPLPFQQSVNNTGTNRNAAYIFNFAARDRLAISDDGDGFQHGPRITRRFFLEQAADPVGHAFFDLKTVTASQLLQTDRPLLVVLAYGFEGVLNFQGIRLFQFRKHLLDLLDGHRLAGCE